MFQTTQIEKYHLKTDDRKIEVYIFTKKAKHASSALNNLPSIVSVASGGGIGGVPSDSV